MVQMCGGHTQVRIEQRSTFVGEFLSLRPLQCDSGIVRRLTVYTDLTGRFPVLVLPNSGPLLDLRSGEEYIFENLLLGRCGAERETVNQETVLSDQELSMIEAVVAQLGIDGTFAVVDDQASIAPVGFDFGDNNEK